MELELSTSPRSTWVWAADIDQVAALREILGPGARAAVGRNSEDRVLDLDIGVVAADALDALAAAGYSFRWHAEQQHPLNRTADIYGVPVAGAEGQGAG